MEPRPIIIGNISKVLDSYFHTRTAVGSGYMSTDNISTKELPDAKCYALIYPRDSNNTFRLPNIPLSCYEVRNFIDNSNEAANNYYPDNLNSTFLLHDPTHIMNSVESHEHYLVEYESISCADLETLTSKYEQRIYDLQSDCDVIKKIADRKKAAASMSFVSSFVSNSVCAFKEWKLRLFSKNEHS